MKCTPACTMIFASVRGGFARELQRVAAEIADAG